MPPNAVNDIEEVLKLIEQMRATETPDVDKFGAHLLSESKNSKEGRFRFLVGLLLSAETRDPITANAVNIMDEFLPSPPDESREFDEHSMMQRKDHRLTIDNVLKLEKPQDLEVYIKEVGFFHKKAVYLYQIAQILREQHDSDVPKTLEQLVELPGIGPKMAKIALSVCYDDVVGISVDTHVNRIAERLKLAGTGKMDLRPEEVSAELEKRIPREFWRDFNHIVVGFGQVWCYAKNPKCADCKVKKWCCYKNKQQ